MYSQDVIALNPQLLTVKNQRRQNTGEHDLQASVFRRCKSLAQIISDYGLVYANVNGQYRNGQRMEPGLKPGIPDIFWPLASGGFNGMYIELKSGKNKLSDAQEDWFLRLRAQGYYCIAIWDSADRVLEAMEAYRQGEIR